MSRTVQSCAALAAAAYTSLLLSAVPVSCTDRSLKKRNNARRWMMLPTKNLRFVGRQHETNELKE